jgi:hypothetical protein
MSARSNIKGDIRGRNLQILEKLPSHFDIIMLAGVDKNGSDI